MKSKNIISILTIVIALGSVIYSLTGGQDQIAYVSEIKEEREKKDRFMQTSSESPFAKDKESQKLATLKYYPPDVKYKVTAALTQIKQKKAVVLGTNDGKQQHYLEYAYADFDMGGYHNRLLILETTEGEFRGKLFLAFGDETSTVETYGSGRYLDVNKVVGSNSIDLDFNKAYNPYCAYVDEYSCPFPPPENLLKVSVKAGEKAYHE